MPTIDPTIPTPAPRQTIDRAIHPALGPGQAVYDNGPAFFLPDAGGVLHCRSIGWGGCSSSPHRSYTVANTIAGERVELDTTDLPHGDRHHRRWHAHHGAGWLVALGREVERAILMRFDPDDGKPFEMIVHVLHVGTPDYMARSERKKTKVIKMTPEEEHWRTYKLASGEVIAFRNDAPPVETKAEPASVVTEQGKLF